MPNIEIRGYDASRVIHLRQNIDQVMQVLDLQDDAVTSVIEMDVRSCDGRGKSMPYLRVCGTTEDELHHIIHAFKEAGIHEDVEMLLLDGFIPAKEMTGEKTAS